jgi:hypothetical protein
LRSIYSLKQAALVWNLKIHNFLVKIGFVRSSADPCLYIDVKHNLYITIWVDNLLIVSQHGSDIANFKAQLSYEFEMKDLSEIEHFLGMQISRHINGDITIDQLAYICQILKRFGMSISKSGSTPFATESCPLSTYHDISMRSTQPESEVQVMKVEIKEYQAMVGSLMYTMLCTCPDASYAIQQLSQFNSNPVNADFQATK